MFAGCRSLLPAMPVLVSVQIKREAERAAREVAPACRGLSVL